MPRVGHLERSEVAAVHRAEQERVDAGSGDRVVGRREGGPVCVEVGLRSGARDRALRCDGEAGEQRRGAARLVRVEEGGSVGRGIHRREVQRRSGRVQVARRCRRGRGHVPRTGPADHEDGSVRSLLHRDHGRAGAPASVPPVVTEAAAADAAAAGSNNRATIVAIAPRIHLFLMMLLSPRAPWDRPRSCGGDPGHTPPRGRGRRLQGAQGAVGEEGCHHHD